MERKDGTTDIFKTFLGDVVYKGVKTEEQEHKVLVRAIEFNTNDNEFNETDVDFRGNPQYSKMIVKLCNYTPRNDFINKVALSTTPYIYMSQLVPAFSKGIGRGERVRDQKSGMEASKHVS